jgi:hypothetical protein
MTGFFLCLMLRCLRGFVQLQVLRKPHLGRTDFYSGMAPSGVWG